jgi:hypothetical protein
MMSLEQEIKVANWESANRNPPLLFISQYEQRTVARLWSILNVHRADQNKSILSAHERKIQMILEPKQKNFYG